jgi:hypothetical protein
MIKLYPAECRNEILRCGGSVWVGVMNHHNTPAKLATLHTLDRMMQFCKCDTIDTCVDCGALRQEFHKQNAFSVPKHCAHDSPSWSGLTEFNLCWRWSVLAIHGQLLQFRGCMQHTCLVPCDYTAPELLPSSLHHVVKSSALACCFNLYSSISIFSTQCAHSLQNLTPSHPMKY